MAERKSDAERLADLQKKIEAMQAKAAALEARQREADRRADTRRKILIGGALLDLASRDETAHAVLMRAIAAVSRPADKSALEGWTPPLSPSQAAAKAKADAAAEKEKAEPSQWRGPIKISFPAPPPPELREALKATGQIRWTAGAWRGDGGTWLADLAAAIAAAGGIVEADTGP